MQLNRSYCWTCTPGHVATQSTCTWHGNCATATVDTVVLGKFQAACVSKLTVLSWPLHNRGHFSCFAGNVKHSRSLEYQKEV